jgi:anti-sigma regulatory factor (Ser/Thr protein kinase)
MNDCIKIIFPVAMISIRLADDIFKAIAANLTFDGQTAFKIRTVLSEIFSNAFLYCDKEINPKSIEFRGRFKDDKFIASIINEGSGFADIGNSKNEFPSSWDESGRGLKLIKRLSDKVEFIHHEDNRFEVCVEISIRAGEKVMKS